MPAHSSHQPQAQDVLLAQFGLYVHKCRLKPHSFIFCLDVVLFCNKYVEPVQIQKAGSAYYKFLALLISIHVSTADGTVQLDNQIIFNRVRPCFSASVRRYIIYVCRSPNRHETPSLINLLGHPTKIVVYIIMTFTHFHPGLGGRISFSF